MSKLLVDLLGAQERDFKRVIDRLERATLQSAEDIKLVLEIKQLIHSKTVELGLDGQDTTARELYFALRARLIQDDTILAKQIGIMDVDDQNIIAQRIATAATNLLKNEKVLCMSVAGVKKALLAVPPKKTMRLLKLRSLTSVLKRSDARILYALALRIEDVSWHTQIHAKIQRLPAKDIDWQAVEVIAISDQWHDKIAKIMHKNGMFITAAEAGVIVVMPLVKCPIAGATTMALGLIVQVAEQMITDCLPYRRDGFLKGYNSVLNEIAHGKQPAVGSVHGLQPSWRVVHELLARGLVTEMEKSEQSVLLLNDIAWQSVEEKLASLVPSYSYWMGTHYLGAAENDTIVSFHVLDIAKSLMLDEVFGAQSTTHMRKSLWNELQIRYLSHENISPHITAQLYVEERDMV